MKRKESYTKESEVVGSGTIPVGRSEGMEFDIIQGLVVGQNSIRSEGRIIDCWTNSMQAAVAPQPLNLKSYIGQMVKVSGILRGHLWSAQFIDVVHKEGYLEIEGKVIGSNVIQAKEGEITCYRHGLVEAWFAPLNLSEYMGQTITVAGELHGSTLHRAHIIKVPDKKIDRDPKKEVKSLNDLLKIRAANREKIEKINGNLGTALGFKWINNQKTDYPCVIVFVPQKAAVWLIPEEQRVPEFLETDDGAWCRTDVITGGKASAEDVSPLPELTEDNKRIVRELQSGRTGLIGGVQIAFFSDGIEDSQHAFVGTAGIAVKHKQRGKVGFLTNQHVAEVRGRKMYHPIHKYFRIGQTEETIEVAADENWYDGIIDETYSYIRCDCGFIEVDAQLTGHVNPGLHVIGKTGPLLKIDPNNMQIIGQKVISIGRTRGVQRGTIVAYAYEFYDEFLSVYTDLLIIGEDGQAFSWKGDSGKIIVTDDEAHRPVALLWGGWQERLRPGQEQEIWSYAIDLGKVLDWLELELLT